MGAVNSNDPCMICFHKEAVMHSHHTIPRSRGGDDSLQIILCPDCHNTLHSNGVYVVSKINNPRRKRDAKQFWRNAEDEERAQPYLQILVKALLEPIPEGFTRQHLLSVSVETPVFEDMKLLQADLGLPSMEETMLYCIAITLKSRGIKNEDRKHNAKSSEWFIQQ